MKKKNKLNKELIDTLVTRATNQRESSLEYKRPKMSFWKQNEDLYYVRESKTYISNRHNSPLPVMSGMIDTFLAKINDSINIMFTPQGEEDNHKAEIVSALWKHDSEAGYFEQTDRIVINRKKWILFMINLPENKNVFFKHTS